MDAFASPHPSNIQTEYQVGLEAKSKESLLMEVLGPSLGLLPHVSISSFLADCMFLCTVIIIPRFSLNKNTDFWVF